MILKSSFLRHKRLLTIADSLYHSLMEGIDNRSFAVVFLSELLFASKFHGEKSKLMKASGSILFLVTAAK